VGGVALIPLIFGLVEFFKSLFNLDGKKVTVLSAVMGAVLFALYQLQGVLPEPYSQIYVAVVGSLAFGLSASGFYKFVSARTTKQ
jgi:hypothetical protein